MSRRNYSGIQDPSDPDARSVRVAVEVVDIFGNDTLTIVDVAVGGKTGTAK